MERADKQLEDILPGDLDKALDDMDNKLNLTADEKDLGEDILNPELEKEFTEFMKTMQSGASNSEDPLGPLSSMMGDLLKNIAKETAGNAEGGPPLTKEDGNKQAEGALPPNFEDLFGQFEKNPQFDQFTNRLLYEFMDKEVLEEPLKDAQTSYESYLKTNEGKLSGEDEGRFRKQLECINELRELLAKEGGSKEKMIEVFERMQEFGAPPEEITKTVEKEGPFNLFQMMNEQGNAEMGGKGEQNMDGCRVF